MFISEGNASGEESGDDDEDEMPLDNPDVITGLVDTVAILWAINVGKLKKPENVKYIAALQTNISKTLPLFCSFFKVQILEFFLFL